jgi:hypothetical protein
VLRADSLGAFVSFALCAVGVGHFSNKPEPIPLVRRSDIGRSQHCPPAVIPERGQVTEDNSEPSSKQSWTVFHEHEAGSYFASDARHVGPHPAAFAGDSRSFSCNANVLAGKTARYNVNNSSPRSAVKGLNVIPNRERREKPVILSGCKYARCVWAPFDGADGSPSEEMPSEYSATSACE